MPLLIRLVTLTAAEIILAAPLSDTVAQAAGERIDHLLDLLILRLAEA